MLQFQIQFSNTFLLCTQPSGKSFIMLQAITILGEAVYNAIFYIILLIMSRRFEPKDVEAIEKLRVALREDSSHSSNNREEQSTLDGPSLDPLHADLLLRDKVTDIRITGHELVAPSEDAREFASYEIEVNTVDLCYRLSRRFSEFHQLYRQVRKNVSLKCEFPRKVYNPFVSSTSPAIVEERSSKLHFFLKEVLNYIRASRDSAITTLLFNFLALKQHYEQKQLTTNYKKCNSEKLAYYRMLCMKPALSDGLRTSHDENTLEFKLMLLAHNGNSDKCLKDIDELLKARRGKLALDEIKTLFVGDGECPGLLRYGLTNPSQINRVTALEMLLGLLLPERNPHFQKFQRVLEKLLTEEWRVQEVSLFDSSLFKVAYFRLLMLYCERMEREYNRSEAVILKDLFLFHQDLLDDYLSWKKMHLRENGLKAPLQLEATIDCTRKIEISEFEDQQKELTKIFHSDNPGCSAYLSRFHSILTFFLQTGKEIKQEQLLNWNRYVSNLTVDEYTSLVRTTITLGRKQIGLRTRTFKPTQAESILKLHKETVKQLNEIKEATQIMKNYDFLMYKEEYPCELQSELYELAWVKRQEGKTKLLLSIRFIGGLTGTNISIDQIAKDQFDDLTAKFTP